MVRPRFNINSLPALTALLLLLLGAGKADASPKAYLPVFTSGNLVLQKEPLRFSFTTMPAGGTYHVTSVRWRGWGAEHAAGQVRGYFTCNQHSGACDGFVATLKL